MGETYVGGLEKNKHEWKKQRAGRGSVGKTPVVGAREREMGQIVTDVVESNEFNGRHNRRPLDTMGQMVALARGCAGKRLMYEDLVGPPNTRTNGQMRMV